MNPETLKEFDFSFDPGSIQVFHNEIDGLQNLIFPEPRGRNQNFFLRKEDFEFAPNDDIYRIQFDEGKQIVGLFAKLREEEIEVEPNLPEEAEN